VAGKEPDWGRRTFLVPILPVDDHPMVNVETQAVADPGNGPNSGGNGGRGGLLGAAVPNYGAAI
jgi:hypothetical protein